MDAYQTYVDYCNRIGVKPMAELLWRMNHGYSHANGAHIQANKASIKTEALNGRIAMTKAENEAAVLEPE